MAEKIVIGVDVGGTFTDILAFEEKSGRVSVAKTPSTKEDQSKGFLEGILKTTNDLSLVSTIIHGTTVATNALLERKGAKTGIITTLGFRDVLEMRRRDRPKTWGLWGTFTPVVERKNRLEVSERTLADGTIRSPIDEKEVENCAKTLLENGCSAVCLFLINGYANPENERRAAKVLRSVWPNKHVSVATEILPEIREFERCSTATLNAYLQPPVANYLERLETRISEERKKSEILIVQSNGGVMSVETAKSLPIRTALSGPAAGVVAARQIAKAAGFENIITGGARNNIGKNGKYYLPNIMVRYCTEHLKMKPIFDWWKNKINQIVEMRIGFRANETKRASKMISKLNLRGFDEMKTIIGSRGTRNKWGMIEWRKPTFPLIKDQIYKDKIENYWQTNKEVRFEKGYYNNCVGCFHRNAIFLKKMSEEHPRKMEWFANIEEENFPNKFKKDITYKEIMNHKKQFEIEWEDFSDCDSGFCGI